MPRGPAICRDIVLALLILRTKSFFFYIPTGKNSKCASWGATDFLSLPIMVSDNSDYHLITWLASANNRVISRIINLGGVGWGVDKYLGSPAKNERQAKKDHQIAEIGTCWSQIRAGVKNIPGQQSKCIKKCIKAIRHAP